MDDFKVKLIITILSSIIFSFIFIILAFVLPTQSEESTRIKKSADSLEGAATYFKKEF